MNFWLASVFVVVMQSASSEAFSPRILRTTHAEYVRARSRLWEQSAASTDQRQAHMNQYNLPIDQIVAEWTANLMAKTREIEEGVYLGVKSGREIFVDTLQVSIPRREGQGLGIVLQEIAGGRQDGLGITVVSGLVPGSSADGNDIMIGDSISCIAVLTRANQELLGSGLLETQEMTTIRTECLGYDATVAAISSLPAPSGDDERIFLTIKRLRRKPKVTITLQYPPSQREPDVSIQLFAGENLRLGMLVRGVKLNDPLAKRFDTKSGGNCGASGLCRTCAVSVVRGVELLNPPKVNEQQMLQNNPRWRLACKAFVGHDMREGEMVIKVNPNQWGDQF